MTRCGVTLVVDGCNSSKWLSCQERSHPRKHPPGGEGQTFRQPLPKGEAARVPARVGHRCPEWAAPR